MQWGNYEGTPSHTYTVLDGIRERLSRDVRYEKGCDLLSNEVFDSHFHQLSHDGRTGLKATYWNNLEMKGEAVATQELATPINKNNGGNTVFAVFLRQVLTKPAEKVFNFNPSLTTPSHQRINLTKS